MQAFFYKLLSPRATFPHDITEAEAAVMRDHAHYWEKRIASGLTVHALGPVFDPAGAFGIAVIEVEDQAQAHVLARNDPAILSGCGFRYELHPMPRGVMHSP